MTERVVVLGFMSHFPVAGVAWQTLHYLVGLRRLGYDVVYAEAHGCSPSKLMRTEDDDGGARAAEYINGILRRFGLGDRWAYIERDPGNRRFGPMSADFASLCRDSAFVLNLHGGHMPAEDITAGHHLVYVGTDPVEVETEVHEKKPETIAFLDAHIAHFTFGENLGRPGCLVPAPERFRFHPTRQPVVLDFWEGFPVAPGAPFTTIGNWRQPWRTITLDGVTYRWSKHLEFERFLALPRRTSQPFELALSSFTPDDRATLETHGWRVVEALSVSQDLDAYREYIGASRGEFTVAKEQNIRLRSGWFSDRAATYLAAGRPVVTQDTGFGEVLPTGDGLFAFQTLDEAAEAIARIVSDEDRNRRAAREIARECFAHEVVLGRMLDDLGVRRARPPHNVRAEPMPVPPGTVLSPLSRWPTRLPPETIEAAARLPAPVATRVASPDGPRISVVVVTHNGLPYTSMCLSTLLRAGWRAGDELIVVDNASTDGTPAYLADLARRNPCARVLPLDRNLGFAAANNRGLAAATGDILVLLNNDTLVPRGWRAGLCRSLDDPAVGLVGPVTNRTCNEAQIDAPYRTYAEFEAFAAARSGEHAGERSELPMLAMFCLALRRDAWERIGPLDEQFETGMFEDDDYSRRARAAGYRIACAEDVFVHHFGQASLGELCVSGEYDRVLEANRRRFEAKWGEPWKPHGRRVSSDYDALRARVRREIEAHTPRGATVAVVNKGDAAMLEVEGRAAWPFPRAKNGEYAYHYPADGVAAVAHLESLRALGATHLVIPATAAWWLDHYVEFRDHLRSRCRTVANDPGACEIVELGADGV